MLKFRKAMNRFRPNDICDIDIIKMKKVWNKQCKIIYEDTRCYGVITTLQGKVKFKFEITKSIADELSAYIQKKGW